MTSEVTHEEAFVGPPRTSLITLPCCDPSTDAIATNPLWDNDQSDTRTPADALPDIPKFHAVSHADTATMNQEHGTMTVGQSKNYLPEPLGQLGRVAIFAEAFDLDSDRANIAPSQNDVEAIVDAQDPNIRAGVFPTELLPRFDGPIGMHAV